ncbi:ABC transporter substrate-binding protein [Methylobacterium sp. CB376]|nr:ABC transporter substrate-binding protein [Methylobacterium nodulans]WFT83520.1 ABC transporter substrate-binding protein [Methylobacterium nodulans]
MRRRDVLRGVAASAPSLILPSRVVAQVSRSKPARVAFLTASSSRRTYLLAALRRGLAEAGYVEGENLLLEARFAENQPDKMPALVAELLTWQPDVIVASGTTAALAVREASSTVALVFAAVSTPKLLGLSDIRPRLGQRSTGLTSQNTDLVAKRVDLLKELVPGLRYAAFVYHREDISNVASARLLMSGEVTSGLQLKVLSFGDADEAKRVLEEARASGAEAALVGSGLTVGFYVPIADVATRLRLPTLASERSYPEQGGLSSYATNFADQLRRAAFYVDRILKGAAPETMPIEQPTSFEFIINMRTARALGIDVAPALVARASELIE